MLSLYYSVFGTGLENNANVKVVLGVGNGTLHIYDSFCGDGAVCAWNPIIFVASTQEVYTSRRRKVVIILDANKTSSIFRLYKK